MEEQFVEFDRLEKSDNIKIDKKKKYIKFVIALFALIIIIGLVIFLILFIKGKEDEIYCEPGYFIPDDDFTKKNCEKCSISNCEICKGNKSNNICYSCDKNYFPFIEANVIESCELDDKNCLIRDNQTNKCLNCSLDYYLVNGKCKSYSFMATYHINYSNDNFLCNK